MKSFTTLTISTGIVFSIAVLPARAGTISIGSSSVVRVITNGTTRIVVEDNSQYFGTREAYSENSIEEHGSTLTESGSLSSTYDPETDTTTTVADEYVYEFSEYTANSYSYVSESGTVQQTTKVKVVDTNNYQGYDMTHSLSSSFDF